MCRNVEHGGHRCPQSTKIATVRRTARRRLMKKFPQGVPRYQLAKAQEEAVSKYLKTHPEVAQAMLPEQNEFNSHGQVDLSKRRLKTIAQQEFTPIVVGTPDTSKMVDEFEVLESQWTNEEANAVHQYTVTGFEEMNAYLRDKNFFRRMVTEAVFPESYAEAKVAVLNRIQVLAQVIKKGQVETQVPRKVYRYVRLPDGISPREYLDRYMAVGSVMKNSGFLSTSADPGFILAHMLKKKGSQRYLVLEMLTKQGISVQRTNTLDAGNVQSLEHEVLMAPESEFAIVDISRRGSITVGEDANPVLAEYLSRFGRGSDLFESGRKHSVSVVRLVDSELLNSDV